MTNFGHFLQMSIITVHLPFDQRTVIQVSPTMTMPQLLKYICEKRNLNPAHHSLALPSPTSAQMRMVTREMTVSLLQTPVITLVDLKGNVSIFSNSCYSSLFYQPHNQLTQVQWYQIIMFLKRKEAFHRPK